MKNDVSKTRYELNEPDARSLSSIAGILGGITVRAANGGSKGPVSKVALDRVDEVRRQAEESLAGRWCCPVCGE